MEQTVQLSLTGRAKVQKSESIDNKTRVRTIDNDTLMLEIDFSSPSEFHTFVWNSSPYSMAEEILQDEDKIPEPRTWSVRSISINSKTAREWAEEIAKEENVPKIDVLLRWLQNIPSQRIRRAVDYELQDEGFDIEAEKI